MSIISSGSNNVVVGQCKKVTPTDPGEGARVWQKRTNEYVTLGAATVRWATFSNGETHEDRVKEARDNLNKAIETYSQIAYQTNEQTKE